MASVSIALQCIVDTTEGEDKPTGAPNGLQHNTDPPSYEEATNPNTTPPSYESLFGRVKEVKKSSKGILDFLKNLLVLVLGTIGYTAIIVGTVVIPIAMIVMGSMYMYECPQGENIPVHLLVGGLVGVFQQLLRLSVRMKKTPEEMEAEREKHQPAQNLLCWFMIAWFVMGSYWVYELCEPNFDPGLGPYCNRTLYLFAYWLITSTNVFFALVTFCVCSLAITTFWMYHE